MPDFRADIALIGGSSTFGFEFTDDSSLGTRRLARGRMETEFGESPELTLFELTRDGSTRKALTVTMHGWEAGVPRFSASQALFAALRDAGVTSIVAEGGVGAVNRLLKPRDLVVLDDFIDWSKTNVSVGGGKLLMMRQPFCPELSASLATAAESASAFGRVFDRGIYLSTEGQRFESAAEIEAATRLGADVVGQSAVPEVYLAREIGACYAAAHLVVNYAEGVVKPWSHAELAEIFADSDRAMAGLLLDAMAAMPLQRACDCASYARESLLRSDGSEPPSRS